jgi:putative endonuclease
LSKCYCGSTDNFAKRLNEHNAGKENFTSKGILWEKVKIIEFASRSEAMKLENQIKKEALNAILTIWK